MRILLVTLALIAFSYSANAEESGVKMAMVNMQKIEQKSSNIKKLVDVISEKRKKHYDEFQQMEKNITKDTEDLKAKASVLSSDKIKKEELEIQKKIDSYTRKIQQQSKIFELVEISVLKKLNECMLQQVNEIGKKQEYDLILQSSHVVFYSSKIRDITDLVVEKFDNTKCKIDLQDYFKQAEKDLLDMEKRQNGK